MVPFPGTCPLDQAVAVEDRPTDPDPADRGLAGLVLGVDEAKRLTDCPTGVGRRSPVVLTKAFGGR